MPLISAKDQQTIRDLFAQRLQQDVTVTYFTQHDSVLSVPGEECAYCRETRELLEDLGGLSDKLRVEVKDFVRDEAEAKRLGVTRIPAIVLSGQNKGTVRFFGVPAGYEFSTLVEDLMTVSSGESELLDSTKQSLDALHQDLHIQVFVTPT
jgi:alkyl hydroperoxide reductase subunit AhpF